MGFDATPRGEQFVVASVPFSDEIELNRNAAWEAEEASFRAQLSKSGRLGRPLYLPLGEDYRRGTPILPSMRRCAVANRLGQFHKLGSSRKARLRAAMSAYQEQMVSRRPYLSTYITLDRAAWFATFGLGRLSGR